MTDKKEQPKVVVYSTQACPWCHKAKDYLDEHDIKYEDVDVSQDHDRAQEMVKKSGQNGVPVIEVGDTIIVGFDREKLAELLGIKE